MLVPIITGMLLMFVLTLGILYAYHAIKTHKEATRLNVPGTLVDVGSYRMHVFQAGQGEKTFIFLAGLGTTSPFLDFKPLIERIKPHAKVIVLERAGYGFSGRTRTNRTISDVVEDYKKALAALNIEGPYWLVPHSMAGLESLYWAQTYQQEIKGIIALDISIPEVVRRFTLLPGKMAQNLQWLIGFLGLSRFMKQPQLEDALPLLKTPLYNDEEKQMMIHLFYKNFFNRTVLKEVRALDSNAAFIHTMDQPHHVPVKLFISQDNIDEFPEMNDEYDAYFKPFHTYDKHLLATHHYLHHEEAALIVKHLMPWIKKKN